MYTESALNTILLTSAAGFAATRVYAIFGQNVWLFLITLVLGLLPPAISIYTFTLITPISLSTGVCGYYTNVDHLYQSCTIGIRASSLVFDGVILILTCAKMQGFFPLHPRTMLYTVLMRDTTVYFLILFILNLIGMALGHLLNFIDPISTWIAIFTSILLSRLLLDLRKVSEGNMQGSLSFTIQTIMFANPITNIDMEEGMADRVAEDDIVNPDTV